MIGRQIGDHGDPGTAGHIHELEGAELHHREILRLHLPAQRQQRRADIAAQPHGISLCLQHFGNQRCGGGLSVGAGNGDQVAGTNLEKHFHLTGNCGTALTQRCQRRVVGVHTGGAEHHIRLQSVQIALAHLQGAAQLFQLQHLRIQLLPRSLITAGDGAAKVQQKLHQRAVADAKAQNHDPLSPQGSEIFIKSSIHTHTSR